MDGRLGTGPLFAKFAGRPIIVRFCEEVATKDRGTHARDAGIHDEICAGTPVPGERYTLYMTDTPKSQLKALNNLRSNKLVERACMVFETDNTLDFATDRVVIEFQAGTNGVQPEQLCPPDEYEILKPPGDRCWVARLRSAAANPDEAASAIAARAKQRKIDVSVKPDLVSLYKAYEPSARDSVDIASGDPLEPHQYAMKLIRARDAQQYVEKLTGAREAQQNPEVKYQPKIAIIDSGVEDDHPDLYREDAKFYDVFQRTHGADPLDAHGTACAGLALASANGRGIRGVAPGSGLIGVKFVEQTAPVVGTRNLWKMDVQAIARAIDYAWRDAEADVISLSWGWHLYREENLPILKAIRRALRRGRGEKGCVVVAAAGNEGMNFVSWPASMKDVIAVGATGKDDKPKTRGGENDWGSNRGEHLNVMAPGVDIITTDLLGEAGYRLGNYIYEFKGTSAATPMVAGVAALVIAANPNLTGAEVRRIIMETADKVGGADYDAIGRSAEMGFGRVNAEEAVKAADRMCQTCSNSLARTRHMSVASK